MIGTVDCALAVMAALCIGLLVGGFNRSSKQRDKSQREAAANRNAGDLWVFVPYRNCDKSFQVAPCISQCARDYSQKHRN